MNGHVASILVALVGCALISPGIVEGAGKSKKKPPPGIVKISAMPLGSSVAVDGEFRCSTPCTLELDPGDHTIKISMKGFVDADQSVTIEPNIVEKISVNLAKSGKGKLKTLPTTHVQSVAAMGVLTVTSDPGGLDVLVNGTPVDDETPLSVEIEQGKYYVTVMLDDGAAEKIIDVEPGKTTLVHFDASVDWNKQAGAGEGTQSLMAAKKAMLEEMLAIGFARLVIDADQDGPFSLLVNGSPTGHEPGPEGKLQLVMPAGQTVALSFDKPQHKGLSKSLVLESNHEYRLHVDFLMDYESQIAALIEKRPDIEEEPIPPVYEPASVTTKASATQCLFGGILTSIGMTAWLVAPIMITGGVRIEEKGLAIGGGVFIPIGLAFNIWGIYSLVKGCRKIEQMDAEAEARNEEKREQFEQQMALFDEALAIDEQISKLEAGQASSPASGSVTAEDMGPSKEPVLSPEAEELSKEVYGEFLVGD